jgi:gluconolactonase
MPSILRCVLATMAGSSVFAQVTFHAETGKEWLAADAKIEKVVGERKFTEGPVWLAKEQRLLFSDIPAQQWWGWSPKEGAAVWRPSAGANGNTLDREGRVVSCQHGDHNLIRHEADGSQVVLVDAHDGKPLSSPNDLAVRHDGTIWFSDPTYGLGKRERAQAGNFVYRFDPTSKTLVVVQRDFDMPNGVCFAPDHQRLYIADSGKKQRVGAFPVTASGELGEPVFWLEGGADGIRCDARGGLWTTASDGVRLYNDAGQHLATVALPERPSNCAFGGVDGKTLFVTARTSVYAFPVLVLGASMPATPAVSSGNAGGQRKSDAKRD